MKKYRIVIHKYLVYEVQVWRWWWPFWKPPVVNVHSTIEEAEQWAKLHASSRCVKYLGSIRGVEE